MTGAVSEVTDSVHDATSAGSMAVFCVTFVGSRLFGLNSSAVCADGEMVSGFLGARTDSVVTNSGLAAAFGGAGMDCADCRLVCTVSWVLGTYSGTACRSAGSHTAVSE